MDYIRGRVVPPVPAETNYRILNDRNFKYVYDQSPGCEQAILENRLALAEAMKSGNKQAVRNIQEINRAILGLGW